MNTISKFSELDSLFSPISFPPSPPQICMSCNLHLPKHISLFPLQSPPRRRLHLARNISPIQLPSPPR
ncbi:hypothetical protein I7I48_01103 [Histoplasma ohiense]|nr:hypothetical protein I7I48_01103 [Histoplasma ohiense (nom. inval.)]